MSSVVEAGGRGMLTCARRSLTSGMPAAVFAAGADSNQTVAWASGTSPLRQIAATSTLPFWPSASKSQSDGGRIVPRSTG